MDQSDFVKRMIVALSDDAAMEQLKRDVDRDLEEARAKLESLGTNEVRFEVRVERQGPAPVVNEWKTRIESTLKRHGFDGMVEEIRILGPSEFELILSNTWYVTYNELVLISDLFETRAIDVGLEDESERCDFCRTSEDAIAPLRQTMRVRGVRL